MPVFTDMDCNGLRSPIIIFFAKYLNKLLSSVKNNKSKPNLQYYFLGKTKVNRKYCISSYKRR